jgi:hypothetical protein
MMVWPIDQTYIDFHILNYIVVALSILPKTPHPLSKSPLITITITITQPMCDLHFTNTCTYYAVCGHKIPTNPCLEWQFASGLCPATGKCVQGMIPIQSYQEYCKMCAKGRVWSGQPG